MSIIEFDQQLFKIINGFVGQSVWFDNIAKLMVNEYFIPTTLSLGLFGLWFFWNDTRDKDLKQKSVVLAALSVVLGSIIVVSILNNLVQRLRPFDVLETNLLFYKPTDPSFPSNSAVVAFALAFSIFVADKRIGLVALILASFYGFLRVFVGVHFPLDVVAGAFIGVSSVIVVNLFKDLLMKVVNFLRNLLKVMNLEEFA